MGFIDNRTGLPGTRMNNGTQSPLRSCSKQFAVHLKKAKVDKNGVYTSRGLSRWLEIAAAGNNFALK